MEESNHLATFRKRAEPRLRLLYGDEVAPTVLESVMKLVAAVPPRPARSLWSEDSVVLISYANQISKPGQSPLRTLSEVFWELGLPQWIETVHILPFHPFSSDDGFSVINYYEVNPEFGTWEEINRLSGQFRLMFDFVVNHISRQSGWFQGFVNGDEEFKRFFIAVDPATNLSNVVRPRSLPLLTPIETSRGIEHIWTTFSDDQMDLNFRAPEVLLASIAVLIHYIARGASMIRLDAVNYIWKEIGTTCSHLPQAHEIVKLFRDVVDCIAPDTVVISETNVPYQENISYFGDGDEVHMVYNFSLPPLLLEGLLRGSANRMRQWLESVAPPALGTTFFNFTSSHDGIGVRGAQGILSDQELNDLIAAVIARGGKVSMRRGPNGEDVPYELNITYLDALGDERGGFDVQVRRFLLSKAVGFAMQGVPAIYVHNLFGSTNYYSGVARTGRARTINRRVYDADELRALLASPTSTARIVFDGTTRLLRIRKSIPAFHPDEPQRVIDTGSEAVLGFERSLGDKLCVCYFNFSLEPQQIQVPAGNWKDAISGAAFEGGKVKIRPLQAYWLRKNLTAPKSKAQYPYI